MTSTTVIYFTIDNMETTLKYSIHIEDTQIEFQDGVATAEIPYYDDTTSHFLLGIGGKQTLTVNVVWEFDFTNDAATVI